MEKRLKLIASAIVIMWAIVGIISVIPDSKDSRIGVEIQTSDSPGTAEQ